MRSVLFLFVSIVLFVLPLSVLATPAQDIARVEAWFDSLRTARARFTQTDNTGQQLTGTFSLSRPGKLRFTYDASDDFIVADGVLIYFYDSVVGEQTNALIGTTLADFLLRADFRITGDGDLRVTDVRHEAGLLQVTIVQAGDPTGGSLSLAFREEPFDLAKWRVVDAAGQITEVELFHMERGVRFPKGTFVYKNPKGPGNRD